MNEIYKEISKCRICGNSDLVSIIDLGNQYLTGAFPSTIDNSVASGPLELVKCNNNNTNSCGLLQLKHSYNQSLLYGEGYGYHSSLNSSMVSHLKQKVEKILNYNILEKGDTVVDIGSNDGTLLKIYPPEDLTLLGIDPTGVKFKKFYPEHIHLIPEIFSSKSIQNKIGTKKVKVVTSIAMFYDLEDPTDFMQQVFDILDDNGIWVFEQSYMLTMLERTAYDTICHEHLEYYALAQITWMCEKVGFKIIDVELNEINGGSFSVTVAKADSSHKVNTEIINRLQEDESKKLSSLSIYNDFKTRVFEHKKHLKKTLQDLKSDNKVVLGYGASTKGNVILQYCGFTKDDIPCIAEVNPDKFGCYTPGSNIPIVSEAEAKKMNPDYFMVLPWHFRENIVLKEAQFLKDGGKLLLPLPQIEVV